MEEILYKTEEFEGPLDLLLHLISKHKLNIYDIKISELLDQYIKHIEKMKAYQMDIASEFLEMASKLIYIKTASLLPKKEEAEILKQELEGTLLEYKECKHIANLLATQIQFNSFTKEQSNIEFDMTYNRKHNVSELFNAYLNVIGKKAKRLPVSKEKFSNIISKRIVSVSSKIIYVLRKMWNKKEVEYFDIFKENKDKPERVATFLAVLELVKAKRIRIKEKNNEPIKLKLIKKAR